MFHRNDYSRSRGTASSRQYLPPQAGTFMYEDPEMPNEDYYPESGGPRRSNELVVASGRSRQADPISFEDALRELFNLLNETLHFYSHFKRAFEDETRGIAGYATMPLLNELWERRVHYHEDHHMSHSKKDRSGQDKIYKFNHRQQETTQSFKSTYRQLRKSFLAVLQSSPPRSNPRAQHGEGFDDVTYSRLVAKITNVGREITNSAVNAGKRIGEIKALLTEMELLRTYLERYKEVWQGSKQDNGQRKERRQEKEWGSNHGERDEGRWGGGNERADSQYSEDDGKDQGGNDNWGGD